MPHEFDLAGVNTSASSLAGFGYQDPRYSAIDGMSPAGSTVNQLLLFDALCLTSSFANHDQARPAQH